MLDRSQLQQLVNQGLSDPEIADKVGVSSRTVLRWRKRYEIASQWQPVRAPHGTNSRYNAGCSCEPCRTAHTAHHGAWRRRRNLHTIPAARRAYQPWTPTEDAQVLALMPAEAAELLDRSYTACVVRRGLLRAQEVATA